MYDRYQQIIFDAQISAAIVGDPATHEFTLVDLVPGIPEVLFGRGFVFVGVVGAVDGVLRVAFATALDSTSVDAIVQGWAEYLAATLAKSQPDSPQIKRPTQDDSEMWLWRLWSLPDTRTEANA
jgi:hypothetical protein